MTAGLMSLCGRPELLFGAGGREGQEAERRYMNSNLKCFRLEQLTFPLGGNLVTESYSLILIRLPHNYPYIISDKNSLLRRFACK